jgi:hypothetical protein
MTARGGEPSVAAMKTRTPVLAISMTVALALTACGGSSHKTLTPAQYKAKLAALGRQDDKAHAGMDNLPHAKSVAAMRSGMRSFAAAERRLGNEVAALEPPANAAAANALLAKGFRDTAGEIGHVLQLLAPAKTPQQALQVLGRAGSSLSGGKELDAALAKLRKLGYAHGS